MLEDSIYVLLCKLARSSNAGRIRAKQALTKLGVNISQDTIEVRKAMLRLRDAGKVEYSTGPHGEPISAFITVILPKIEIPLHVASWKEVLEESSLQVEDRLALEPIGNAAGGFSKADMVRLLSGLVRLRAEQAQMYGQCDFNVSATYLLASSKLLSTFDSRALRTFGIAVERFPSRAPYVVVGGTTKLPVAVILVENPMSFEMAVRSSAAERCLFVCTFGFGLSAAANDYGNQLAGIIESGRAVVLNRSGGAVATVDQILCHSSVHFWGDLDIAGIQIFERIAKHIPSLQFSALYRPMIDAITAGDHRHPYVAAVGKSGQTMFSATREDSEAMLRYCSEWAVDQEFVAESQINVLAGESIRLPD